MKQKWLIILLISISLTGCSSQSQSQEQAQDTQDSKTTEAVVETEIEAVTPVIEAAPPSDKYKEIEVDGGDMSGYRQANVVVDIGFGDRQYWAYTNQYGQLVRVTAEEIILQDDTTEPVKSNGRYYNDIADVDGTERADMDKGHIIADSLGGVSNAYNITPQESTLNRHGNQAYMEKVIRDAGGCTDFEASITYPDTTTQIPSQYHYTYTLNGNVITDDFDNVNPDEVNKAISTQLESIQSPSSNESHDISSIDKNGNGQVTIAEAKAAGFKMPITKEHWLYQYMDDRDGDGMVGE
ncbi:MAG: DNA/RNA non-specific endonuclease [Bacteroidales bacterium]|nr:DNA/RNA non-specific endonuclease [Bacteroidales bacterium]